MSASNDATTKIRFQCPACEVKLKAPASRAGSQFACPKCSEPVTVPAADADTAADPSRTSDAELPERQQWALARCPDCEEVLKVKVGRLGDPVACPYCAAELIVEEAS